MELRILHYFLAVVREGNMTKAAEKLHLTQPTLSRQIMQLEEELGVTLFDRSHNLELTSDGIVLKHKAQEILNLVDQTKQSFQQEAKPLTGTIRMGTSEYAQLPYVMNMITTFQQLHPYVTFDFYTGDISEIEEKFLRHQLDIAIMTPVFAGQTYTVTPLPITETWGVLVQHDSPLAAKPAVKPVDLCGQSLIMPSSPLVCTPLYSWLHTYVNRVRIVATSNLIHTAAILVAQQGSVAFCTEHTKLDYEGLRFLPLSPLYTMPLLLIRIKNMEQPPAVAAFVSYVKQLVAPKAPTTRPAGL